jgi:T5orf172 domain
MFILQALSGRVIKIGTAGDIAQRENQLRAERYGGFSDWSVLIHVEVNDAGRIEREVSSRIRGKKVFNGYVKDGREQVAIEILQCGLDHHVFDHALPQRAYGLVGHEGCSCLYEGCEPLSQDRTPRGAIVLAVPPAAAPYRASGLVQGDANDPKATSSMVGLRAFCYACVRSRCWTPWRYPLGRVGIRVSLSYRRFGLLPSAWWHARKQ